MKALKIISLIIVIIIITPLIIALFLKKDIKVEEEVIINASKEEVYSYVVLLKNQNSYSKWALSDPKMKSSFRGVDGTVGFVSAWTSEDKNTGEGEQEITKISDDRIEYELRFIKPFKQTNFSYMEIHEINENQTLVKWGFESKMKYPINIFLLFMDMEKMLSEDLSTGLNNLKKILENMSIDEKLNKLKKDNL